MWLLSTLLDDVMHDGVKLRDDDRAGYERCESAVDGGMSQLTPVINSIRERLDGVRRKVDAPARAS